MKKPAESDDILNEKRYCDMDHVKGKNVTLEFSMDGGATWDKMGEVTEAAAKGVGLIFGELDENDFRKPLKTTRSTELFILGEEKPAEAGPVAQDGDQPS